MDKYCLITGAASGLGLAFAHKFFLENYNLVLVDKNLKNLNSLKNDLIERKGPSVHTIHQDLSIDGSAKKIHEEVKKLNIKIEILINNAGFGIFGLFSEVSSEKESDLIRLSVLTTTQLTRLFLPDMIKAGKGRIMLVSSLAAFQPAPIMSVYAASKVYLLYLGEALANETKNTGVTITVLCPGMINTNFQKITGNKNPKIGWNIFTAEEVADYGYRALLKGKTVAIPGFASKIMAQLHRIFPRKTATSLVRKIHEKNRSK
ncbi:MAG: SDR family oxidoreductase [Mariniphaga sp.]|nr:SDR family oxidoreductase [Mariniphaga sp.]